jgi:hypothetical protein
MPKCQIVKKVDPPWFGIATTTYFSHLHGFLEIFPFLQVVLAFQLALTCNKDLVVQLISI